MVKGPKVMNPADKARREARKKELKKNKKQRQQVRSAAIEGRDPEQIIGDLEKLDKLEFESATNPTISDNFYKDKRKRLKETLNRILAYYQKEDQEKFAKVKSLESKYENNYQSQLKQFQAIRAAQEVKIEDVFLPPETSFTITEIADDDPLLSESLYITPNTDGLKPPGCPPGPPPDLNLIVNSLKNSLANPVELLVSSTLPADVINFQRINQSSKSKNLQINYKTHPSFNNSRQASSTSSKPDQQAPKTAPQSKPAVIESKPVIFKPKVTKFVPSSVRSKLNRPG